MKSKTYTHDEVRKLFLGLGSFIIRQIEKERNQPTDDYLSYIDCFNKSIEIVIKTMEEIK